MPPTQKHSWVSRWQTKEGAFICSWTAANRIKVTDSHYFHLPSVFLPLLILCSRLRAVTTESYSDSVSGEGLLTVRTGAQIITQTDNVASQPVVHVFWNVGEAKYPDRTRKHRCQKKILGIQPTTDYVADRCSKRLMYPGLHWPGVACRTAVLCVGALPLLSVNTQSSFTSSAGSWSLSSLDSPAQFALNFSCICK